MSDVRDLPSRAQEFPNPSITDADRLRHLLLRAGLSQRAAAKVLEVDERVMRQWCTGQGKPPASIFRALSPRLTHGENLRRMIESNDQTIEALRAGRIAGLGYGSRLGDPRSVTSEIERLVKLNEEHRVLLRWDEAFQRKQKAFFALNAQWLPHGNGMPADGSIFEMRAARVEFDAAQAEVDRIVNERHAPASVEAESQPRLPQS